MKESYFELVRQFPLVPIRNERQYDSAVAFLNKLAIRDEKSLDSGERAFLDALTQFVEDHERDRHQFGMADLRPLDALKFLLEHP